MKSVLYSFLFLPFVLAGKNQTLAPTPDILRPTSIPGTYAPTYEREIHPTPMPTIDRVGLVPEPTPRPTRRPVAMSYEYVMDGFNDGDNSSSKPIEPYYEVDDKYTVDDYHHYYDSSSKYSKSSNAKSGKTFSEKSGKSYNGSSKSRKGSSKEYAYETYRSSSSKSSKNSYYGKSFKSSSTKSSKGSSRSRRSRSSYNGHGYIYDNESVRNLRAFVQ